MGQQSGGETAGGMMRRMADPTALLTAVAAPQTV
jgi:hypothetical protein